MKVLIFKGIIIVVAGSFLMTTSNALVKHKETQSKTAMQADNSSSIVVKINGKEDFQKQILQSPNKCVVKFFATWCGACQAAETPFKELAISTPNVKFAEVDIDKNDDLADQYAPESVPHFVVFENGEKTKEITGFSKESVSSLIT